jgi:transketolase
MRKDSLEMVYEHALVDPRVVFVGSDLGPGTLDKFRQEMPDRFFMEGVSEAAVIGMAAGLAAEGCVVYVNTIAVFLTRRVYEQVALDVCLANLDVRLIGNGGGLVYAPLGPTHLATDDIALMRALPNMTIIAPADAHEMRHTMTGLRDQRGPAYIRLGKGNEPDVTTEHTPAFGKANVMQEGEEVVIATTGVTLHMALEAVELMAAKGARPSLLHFPVVKPLDLQTLERYLKDASRLIVVEEHVPAGGLHAAIAEWLIGEDALRHVRVSRFGLPDVFPDRYGSQDELFAYYGMTAQAIADLALTPVPGAV